MQLYRSNISVSHCHCCWVTQSCPPLCNPTDCSMPGLPVPHHLPAFAKFTSTPLVIPASCPILWCPLSFCPQSFPASETLPSESVLHIRWPKDWSFSFCISPSKEYSELISLTIDWFDLLIWAAQGAFRSLLQHHSSKASILWHSAFFTVLLSQSYVTSGQTIALTIQMFVSRVMSLLFKTLSRCVIASLPRSSCPLIS